MPSPLARKVIIAAAVDGLFIQPLANKKEQKPSPPVKIRYGDAAVSFVSRDALPDLSAPNSSFEAFGIVGTFFAPAQSSMAPPTLLFMGSGLWTF